MGQTIGPAKGVSSHEVESIRALTPNFKHRTQFRNPPRTHRSCCGNWIMAKYAVRSFFSLAKPGR